MLKKMKKIKVGTTRSQIDYQFIHSNGTRTVTLKLRYQNGQSFEFKYDRWSDGNIEFWQLAYAQVINKAFKVSVIGAEDANELMAEIVKEYTF